MIKVNGVSKRIHSTAVLEGIHFEVKPGQVVGLLGPNGAGKTTLLNIIAGIWTTDAGNVEIDGIDIEKASDALRARIGYIPDVPFLYPKLTGAEFLRFVGSLYKIKQALLDQRIKEMSGALELVPWMNALMESYPRGVRQKMTLAAMLLHSPAVILLDEPLTNLDPKSSKVVKELLASRARAGAAVILSTHILEIAEKLCQRVVILQQGRQLADGTMEQLREKASQGAQHLEDIFLQLTGGKSYTELLHYLV